MGNRKASHVIATSKRPNSDMFSCGVPSAGMIISYLSFKLSVLSLARSGHRLNVGREAGNAQKLYLNRKALFAINIPVRTHTGILPVN
jgi:hypothetical protein